MLALTFWGLMGKRKNGACTNYMIFLKYIRRCGYLRALDLRVQPCDDSHVCMVLQIIRLKRKITKCGEEERRKKISKLGGAAAAADDVMESPLQNLNDVDSDDESLSDRCLDNLVAKLKLMSRTR